LSIEDIAKDEAAKRRCLRLKNRGIMFSSLPKFQTMSIDEICKILNMDGPSLKVNKQLPQVVDENEF